VLYKFISSFVVSQCWYTENSPDPDREKWSEFLSQCNVGLLRTWAVRSWDRLQGTRRRWVVHSSVSRRMTLLGRMLEAQWTADRCFPQWTLVQLEPSCQGEVFAAQLAYQDQSARGTAQDRRTSQVLSCHTSPSTCPSTFADLIIQHQYQLMASIFYWSRYRLNNTLSNQISIVIDRFMNWIVPNFKTSSRQKISIKNYKFHQNYPRDSLTNFAILVFLPKNIRIETWIQHSRRDLFASHFSWTVVVIWLEETKKFTKKSKVE